MGELKEGLPAYKRVGECGRCGAGVYAPEGQMAEKRLPWMSACVCARGPQRGKVAKPVRVRRAGELQTSTKAMIA